jgi:hypothetical protein
MKIDGKKLKELVLFLNREHLLSSGELQYSYARIEAHLPLVYPNEALNYEFAFGPLLIHEGGFGIDLRPANPFNKIGEEGSVCCSATKSTAAIFVN